MKISIINGSHRHNAQSAKVAGFLAGQLEQLRLADEIWRFDLTDNPLPLWDEGIWSGDAKWQQLLTPLSAQLASSDGFIIIAPEWHGMAPSGLKNFLLLWGNNELAHKPALIVGVSSSVGGTYPVAELRMNSSKNNRLCYIPEHLIIRNVEQVLNESGENDTEADTYYRERSAFALGLLEQYAQALRPVRAAEGTFNAKFKNGM
ncbi:MAG: NAD(P)H-dependent oxidoreductase [Gammaproteobacteria bacterium SHHR-1]|uniref:NADPH-dependent FMN reductase n=1 Tax=Magnetovirga frankeli TaxID=947516 RepID=UPI001293860E|nr:NAD(P)H-dependent oxidoreductase [gamma proteobacterium SS-5]